MLDTKTRWIISSISTDCYFMSYCKQKKKTLYKKGLLICINIGSTSHNNIIQGRQCSTQLEDTRNSKQVRTLACLLALLNWDFSSVKYNTSKTVIR